MIYRPSPELSYELICVGDEVNFLSSEAKVSESEPNLDHRIQPSCWIRKTLNSVVGLTRVALVTSSLSGIEHRCSCLLGWAENPMFTG